MDIRKGVLAVFGLVLVWGAASAQTVAQSPLFGTVLEYPTSGCGGAVLQTPLPGAQFAASSASESAAAKLFFAQAAARHVTWVKSVQCTHTGRTHVLVPSPDSPSGVLNSLDITNGYSSNNWSGYQISNTAQYVQAGWTVPAITPRHAPQQPPYSANGYYSSIWSGIGGGYGAGTPLIQSGSDQNVWTDGTMHYQLWYEIYGGPTDTGSEVVFSAPGASPGDSVANVAIWTPATGYPGLGTVDLGVCNYTVGLCADFVIGDPTQQTVAQRHLTPQPGDSTEWIVEAPSIGGIGVAPLADFVKVHLSNAVWTSDYVPGGSNTSYTIAQGVSPTTIVLHQSWTYGYNHFSVRASTGLLDGNHEGFVDTFRLINLGP